MGTPDKHDVGTDRIFSAEELQDRRRVPLFVGNRTLLSSESREKVVEVIVPPIDRNVDLDEDFKEAVKAGLIPE